MPISLAHGSTAIPDEPLDFKFALFDYRSVDDKPLDARVNNGIDGAGPGIYAVEGDEAWDFAHKYAGVAGEGSVFGLSLDCDELANALPLTIFYLSSGLR